MMDLTPLDIRKKKGDFTRVLRGYDTQEVDQFLDLAAERLEELVKLHLTLQERADRLGERVQDQEGRERAVQEALVTAQSLKQDIRTQAQREAELIRREAEASAERIRDEMHQILQGRANELVELNRARNRFLQGFRRLLERELDVLEVAENHPPSDEFDLDLLHFGRGAATATDSLDIEEDAAEEPAEVEVEETVAGEAAEAEPESAAAQVESP